ncbi:MAG: hypothetical protein BWK76_03525 [Desulfobulbaceae bacterium A2]|nr:MAG: hypothetical protein BWK76_03525 [Desulfobulbaceae bacterium A2]
MKLSLRDIAAGLFALLVFVLLQRLVATSLPGGALAVLELEAEQACTVRLFSSHVAGRFEKRHHTAVKSCPAGERCQAVIKLNDTTVHSVRLDLDVAAVRLYGLRLESHLAPGRYFSPGEILALFTPQDPAVIMEHREDHLAVRAAGPTISLAAREPLLRAHWFPRHVLPLLVSLTLFLFLRHFDARTMAVWTDIEGKRPQAGENIIALDGLRGLAAVMVVADHTMPQFICVGAAGVLIFFALSGYLLARPFVTNPAMVLSYEAMEGYFCRRLLRVLPIYYCYIFIIYCLPLRFDLALRHLLFLEGAGHLWAIPQMMLFYLLLVPLLLCIHLLFRGRVLVVVPALFALMLFLNTRVDQSVLPMYGMDHKAMRPMAGVFLAGVLLAWLCHGTGLAARLRERGRAWEGRLVALLGLLLLAGGILGANGMLLGTRTVYAQLYFGWYGFAAAVLVACAALAAPASPLGRLLCLKPLRAIGVVSLSLYLVHPLVLQMCRTGLSQYFGRTLAAFPAFVVTLSGGYLLACITYALIERPFFARRPKTVAVGTAMDTSNS